MTRKINPVNAAERTYGVNCVAYSQSVVLNANVRAPSAAPIRDTTEWERPVGAPPARRVRRTAATYTQVTVTPASTPARSARTRAVVRPVGSRVAVQPRSVSSNEPGDD